MKSSSLYSKQDERTGCFELGNSPCNRRGLRAAADRGGRHLRGHDWVAVVHGQRSPACRSAGRSPSAIEQRQDEGIDTASRRAPFESHGRFRHAVFQMGVQVGAQIVRRDRPIGCCGHFQNLFSANSPACNPLGYGALCNPYAGTKGGLGFPLLFQIFTELHRLILARLLEKLNSRAV